MELCPCGSGKEFSVCCEPVINDERPAETAEELMRSRYSAYVKAEVEYIYATTHPDQRQYHDADGTRKWAEKSQWMGLDILNVRGGEKDDTEGEIEFVAHYAKRDKRLTHHELAMFKKENDTWFFLDGRPVIPKQFVREAPKVGRNEPCPCGSGKKFKKCCG